MKATWLSRRRLLLPEGGRLPGGLWMHAACRPTAVVANTFSGHLARVSVGLVPSRRIELQLPFDQRVLAGVLDRVPQLRKAHEWVVLRPSDSRRARIMILGLDENRLQSVFVKATLDEPNPLARQILASLHEADSTIIFPTLSDVFQVEDWWVNIEEPLPQLSHRPAHLDPSQLHALVTMFQGLVPQRGGLVCSHGDLGPWNVRQFAGGQLGVLDWEYATWAPAAADELWYALTFRLATTRQAAERVGRKARDELAELYPSDELRRAAEFVVAHRDGPEPAEILEGVERSPSLLSFEKRLADAIAVFVNDP